MDTRPLVEEQVEAGGRFLRLLSLIGVDVTVACWAETGEDGEWYLYIASEDVDKRGSSRAYRTVYAIVREFASPWITFSNVKLLGTEEPATQDLLQLRAQLLPSMRSTVAYVRDLGHVPVYVYPEVREDDAAPVLRPELLNKFVDQLLDGTRKGVLPWHRDRQQAGTFVLGLNGGTVRLGKHPRREAYALGVRNQDAEIVGETGTFLDREANPRLAELYAVVASQARQPAGLDSILSEVTQRSGGANQ